MDAYLKERKNKVTMISLFLEIIIINKFIFELILSKLRNVAGS